MFSIMKNVSDAYSSYRSISFRNVLEDHLEILKTHNVTTLEVPYDVGVRYLGDFTSLLNEFDIPEQYHYPTIRINGLYCSYDYNQLIDVLHIPDLAYVDRLLNLHQTRLR